MSIGHTVGETFFTNIGKESGIVVHFSKFSKYWNASTSLSTNVIWRNALKFNIPVNSPHQWYEFEGYFRTPDEVDGGFGNDLSNIIISQDADKADRNYLYIDDVELIDYDPCNHPCLDQRLNEPIKLYCCTPKLDNVIPNVHDGLSLRPWNLKVENALETKFEILNRWGC